MAPSLQKTRDFNAYRLIRPLLFQLDAETAHGLAIKALHYGLGPKVKPDFDPILRTSVCGIDFPNPIGLAAGFDKQCEVVKELLQFGFGHIEVGGVVPEPQSGNPRPRLFRIASAEAIINRFDFNSDGFAICQRRVAAWHDATPKDKRGHIGINIGTGKSVDAAAAYIAGMNIFAPFVDYITVNVSCPNTPGMRDMQGREQLKDLLQKVTGAREALAKKPLIWVKIAPDQTGQQLDDIAEVVLASGVHGMIVGNTTTSRPGNLPPELAQERGGLSGKPLFAMSTQVLSSMFKRTGGKLPLIGCGGVFSAEDAYAKIRAGASLVQLYSALVYEGPGIIARINRGLAELLKRDGFGSVSEAVGADHK